MASFSSKEEEITKKKLNGKVLYFSVFSSILYLSVRVFFSCVFHVSSLYGPFRRGFCFETFKLPVGHCAGALKHGGESLTDSVYSRTVPTKCNVLSLNTLGQ